MRKHVKLPPVMRREVYRRWIADKPQRSLARHHARRVIGRIVVLERMRNFQIHDSTNKRFRILEYGLKRIMKAEQRMEKRAQRLVIRRYDQSHPEKMVYDNNELLPHSLGETRQTETEQLYMTTDNLYRLLSTDISSNKSKASSVIFEEIVRERSPFDIEDWYADRGMK